MTYDTSGIAIIGMSARFPGSGNIDEFWRNLCDGLESITALDEDALLAAGVERSALADASYVRAAPILEGIEFFDASLFDMSPSEACLIDPQQRLFLECAWEALEQGGYRSASGDLAVGVYAGAATSSYLLNNLAHLPAMRRGKSGLNMSTLQLFMGNDKDYLSTRVAYKLDLRGPSFTVQSACSSSLLACHVACQALLSRECDIALAGGVSVKVPQHVGYFREPGSIVSSDGHCRAFDAQADGTVFGSGVGVVLLRRLEDALAAGDSIFAVIRGSAANNDGSLKMGFTAPSLEAGARVIEEAIQVAGVSPDSIGYVEAHGTGTNLGDPVEIGALTRAFRTGTDRKGYCAIGSVKTNIGHIETASGIAGLIKTACVLRHEQIPASLHFRTPNPQLDLENSPFFVNTQLRPWKRRDGAPRRAGVTSLGVGGTNVHMVLEEPPLRLPNETPTRPWQLLTLSAHSLASLDAATAKFTEYFAGSPAALPDVAYTLNLGRAALRYRRIAVCRDEGDAQAVLSLAQPVRLHTNGGDAREVPVTFMFPGQGAQYVDMGRELLSTEPTFEACINTCADILQPVLGSDIRRLIYPDPSEREVAESWLKETANTQPALFAIEYALARTWMARGVIPSVLMGHSVGELVAACLAGVFELEDALRLVALRGRLIQEMPRGAMLSVMLSAEKVTDYMRHGLALAAINEPGRCVVSGPTFAIEALEQEMLRAGIEHRKLHTSHGFHSSMLDPVVERFTDAVAQVRLSSPRLRCLSNVTGTWLTNADAEDPRYWGRQLRQPVLFEKNLRCVLEEGPSVLLEVGPGRNLSRFAIASPLRTPEHGVINTLRHPSEGGSDVATFLNALGQLWLRGVPINWNDHWSNEQRRREPLPTYVFDRKRHWIEPVRTEVVARDAIRDDAVTFAGDEIASPVHPAEGTPSEGARTPTESILATIWGEVLGIPTVGIYDNFFELGGDSVMGVRVASKANELGFRFSPKHLFEHQCIAELAAVLDASISTNTTSEPEPDGPQPVLPIQSWLFSRMPEFRRWNLINVVEARDSIDAAVMENVLHALRLQHPTLRTRFVEVSTGWVQEVLQDPPRLSVPVVDLSSVDVENFHARVDACAQEASERIDIERGENVVMVVVKGPRHAGKNDRVILVTPLMVLDKEGAERVLMNDLVTAYTQQAGREKIQLLPATTSAATFAAILSRRARESTAVSNVLEWFGSSRRETGRLPWSVPPQTERSPRDVRQHAEYLDQVDTAYLLGEFQRTRRITVEEIAASAVASVLTEWAGVRHFLMDVLMSSRQIDIPGVNLSRSVGWFSIVYPLNVNLGTTKGPIEQLSVTSHAMRRLRQHEHEHGMLRYLGPDDLRAQLSSMPQADVYFEYGGSAKEVWELERSRDIGERPFRVDPFAADTDFPLLGSFRYVLEVCPHYEGGRLKLLWLYNERFLPSDVAVDLARRCVSYLQRLVRDAKRENSEESHAPVRKLDIGSAQLGEILAELSSGAGNL
jgi:acyl transferase domain-containing protein